jgi:hypothetical protein
MSPSKKVRWFVVLAVPLAVPLEEIARQREAGWTGFHPEMFCHRCGSRNIWSWHVDEELWSTVMGPAEITCPQCFTFAYEQKFGHCHWELRRD